MDAPDKCSEGHLLRYPKVLVGWHPCGCLFARRTPHPGHMGWTCLTCGAVVYDSPCEPNHGYV